MVTINTTDDLLRALQERPEFLQAARSLILSAELLDTPRRLDRISQQVSELFRAMAETDRRLEEFIAATNQRLGRLESDLVEVKSDLAVLKSDLVEVKAKLDQQVGVSMEQKVHNSILNIAKDHLDLTHGQVLKSINTPQMSRRLREAIDAAEEQGIITSDAAANLYVVDLIIRGRRRSDRTYFHVAIEVSRTVNDDDITRARDRANTLATVIGGETAAAVIGSMVSSPQQALAQREGVRIVVPAMFSEGL